MENFDVKELLKNKYVWIGAAVLLLVLFGVFGSGSVVDWEQIKLDGN